MLAVGSDVQQADEIIIAHQQVWKCRRIELRNRTKLVCKTLPRRISDLGRDCAVRALHSWCTMDQVDVFVFEWTYSELTRAVFLECGDLALLEVNLWGLDHVILPLQSLPEHLRRFLDLDERQARVSADRILRMLGLLGCSLHCENRVGLHLHT